MQQHSMQQHDTTRACNNMKTTGACNNIKQQEHAAGSYNNNMQQQEHCNKSIATRACNNNNTQPQAHET
eukprot:3336544-Lingulodinium_polyedra.AAC.1